MHFPFALTRFSRDAALHESATTAAAAVQPHITNNFAAVERRSIWRRLGFRDCVARYNEDVEGFAPACLVVGTVCVLDWKDRLRVLISGKLRMEAAVKTDVIVNRSMARSCVSVLPPTYPVKP